MFRGIVCNRRRGDSQSSLYYTGNIDTRTHVQISSAPPIAHTVVFKPNQTKFDQILRELPQRGRRARAKIWTRASTCRPDFRKWLSNCQTLSWDHVCFVHPNGCLNGFVIDIWVQVLHTSVLHKWNLYIILAIKSYHQIAIKSWKNFNNWCQVAVNMKSIPCSWWTLMPN